jgi:hypothetical protein
MEISADIIIKIVLIAVAIGGIVYLVTVLSKDNSGSPSGQQFLPGQTYHPKLLGEGFANPTAPKTTMEQAKVMMETKQEEAKKNGMKHSNGEMKEGFQGMGGWSVQPSESMGQNEIFKPLEYSGGGEFGLSGNQYPKDCFPKDQLTPAELLPGDANSRWAQSVPAGQGELGDQNFLAAGFHVGVNTVGQTLRNANRQLRSEPPNPQVKVSPWLQTTIEPDTNRRPLEIGGCM